MKQKNAKLPFWILFQALIVCLPLLEIYRSFFGDTIQIFGFAAEEIFCLGISFVLFCAGIVFGLREKKRVGLVILFVYALTLVLYTFFHAQNAAAFTPDLLPLGKPDFLREIYYTVRLYLAPISLIASAYFLSVPKEKIFSSLRLVLWIVSIIIVIPCLFGFSFASYQEGNQWIEKGFFSWLTLSEDSNFAAMTAKGFFSQANDIGAVLFALIPFSTLAALRRGRVYDFVLLFCAGLSCIMIGTKIAAFGFFLSLGAFLIFFVIHVLWQKSSFVCRKNLVLAGCVLLVLIPIFLISPGFRLQMQREEQKAGVRPITEIEIVKALNEKANGDFDSLSEEDVLILSEYLEENAWEHYIDPWFYQLYPARSDPEFWTEVLLRDGKENRDARVFKLEMCQRIRERNGNPLDLLLGMGFTSGIPYAERDFEFQYYQFGIVGTVLLLLPFFAVFIFAAVKTLIYFLKKRPCEHPFATALSLFSFFATAWFAGHVFDTLFPTYILCFVSATLYSPKAEFFFHS